MKSSKRIFISFSLNIFLTLLEFSVGIVSFSSALIADSINNFSDCLLLLIAGNAEVNCTKIPHDERKIRTAAARTNITLMFILAFAAFIQTIYHFSVVRTVNNQIVIVIGSLAVFVNSLSIYLLRKEKYIATEAATFSLFTSLFSGLIVIFSAIFDTVLKTTAFDLLSGLGISIMLVLAGFSLLRELKREKIKC